MVMECIILRERHLNSYLINKEQMEKNIIIIDDEDQNPQKDYIESKLHQDFDVEVHLINTTEDTLGDDGTIDEAILKDRLLEIMKGRSIDLVLTDYELSDDKFTGIDVVKLVKECRQSVPVIMYSGKKKEVLARLLGDYKDRDEDELIASINEFMSWGIEEFIGRGNYSDDAIKFIKKKKKTQVDDVFIQKLREIGDQKCEVGLPVWRDLTLNKICDIIENKKDARSESWTDDLIEQVVAYITKSTEE